MSITSASRDSYQFDLHARYSRLAEILTSMLAPSAAIRILDVGAGPQRLTEEFLPAGFAAVTRTDVQAFEDEHLIAVPPNAALPFPDGAFDAVVAMDVLEHVAPSGRDFFLRECLRVAKTVTVVAAPIGCEPVRRAELDYASAFRRLFKADEPFLVEHEDFGLPDPDQVRSTLEAAGAAVVTVDNVRLADWLALNVANLVLSTVNDGDAVRAAVSSLQNAAIPTDEPGVQHYRRFFIATRDRGVADRLAAQYPDVAPPQADEDPNAALLVLADQLKRYAERYHGPTLEAVVADRELGVKTLGEVVAGKDKHIQELQAVADGLAEGLRRNEALQRTEEALQRANLLIEQQAAALEIHAQALESHAQALRSALESLERLRAASLAGLARRIVRRVRGEAPRAEGARS
ncbi:methyltransferase domain-containing protein [Phenylobacterium sp. LjRoot225]|uniref:class I SAM-dependent methyltransferase n=1 Tax=Phenylobacterium sp. LjRoot225 TaxID=3342285 RepID=UPI003ED03329